MASTLDRRDAVAPVVAEFRPPESDKPRPPKQRGRWWRLVRRLMLVLLAAAIVKALIIEPSVVPTASMQKTIMVGDHILVAKALHGPHVPFTGWRLPRLKQPDRGSIVAFYSPQEPQLRFIKRVVAVAGDTVEFRRGVFYLNGKPAAEPYAQHDPERHLRRSSRLQVVPAWHVFVMGDNRDNSNDSRDWGMLPVANVVGEPVMVYWSYDAPSAVWLDQSFTSRLSFLGSLTRDLMARTRWERTGTLL